MQYVEHEPGPVLRGRARFWRLTGAGSMPMEPVLPDGCVELIVHLGDPFAIEHDGRRELQPRVLFAGPATAPVLLAPTGRTDVIGVRLEAGVAADLVDVPMAELAERIPDLAAIAGDFERGLAEELAAPPRGERWHAVLERRLLRVLRPARRAPALAHAIARVRATGGRVSVAGLAEEANLSTRQLERGFRERVGLGPKTFARLVRFQRALALLRGPGPSLATIAVHCGYFDQAHMVRDFQEFARQSPSRCRADELELAGHFVDGAPARA